MKTRGNIPLNRCGLKDATKDEKQVIKYWSEKPYLNIGIVTGKASGLLAVDDTGRGRKKRIEKVTKHVPADVTVCIFWLKNSKPKE